MDKDWISPPRARIACVYGEQQSFDALTLQFRRAGIELKPLGQARQADLGLIDLRKNPPSARKAKAIAAALRRKSPESPIFFLVAPDLDGAVRAALRRLGEVIPARDDAEHAIERCRQMIRLRNIAEETGERLKSLAALNRLVEFPVIAASDGPANLLIAGAPGATALTAINSLGPSTGKCVCALTAGQTMRALDHDAFDCAIFLPDGDNDPLFSLGRALRRHPRHAPMAIIHVADDIDDLSAMARKGARDFILRAQIAADLAPKAQIAMRRARLARAMRTFLLACRGEGVRDAASGAFTATFLSEHGPRLCARADQTGRPLALTLIRLAAGGVSEPGFGRKALHQAARLINRITRAEDMVARIGPEKFVVLHPATTAMDAGHIARRITGVLANTAFQGGQGAPFSVTVDTAVLQRQAGSSIEETVARLLRVETDTTRLSASTD